MEELKNLYNTVQLSFHISKSRGYTGSTKSGKQRRLEKIRY